MPETAARYGLAQAELVDERRSVPRSTAAAVALLRDLHDAYGQWDLALAAYNLGRERLDEAIGKLRERRGARDAKKPVELEDLVRARLVPKETANFVPQVHAFAIVGSRAAHGTKAGARHGHHVGVRHGLRRHVVDRDDELIEAERQAVATAGGLARPRNRRRRLPANARRFDAQSQA
jgi:hypothetical protein